MTPSIWQIALVILLIVILFGRGKISDLMGDVAKGIKSFKQGMKDDDESENSKASSTDKLENKQEAPLAEDTKKQEKN